MRVSSSPCVLTLLTMSSCTLKVSTCLWRFLTISSAMYVSWIWFSIFKRFVITYFPLHLCLAFSSVDFLAILVPSLSIDFGTSIIWLLLLFSDSSYIWCLCLKCYLQNITSYLYSCRSTLFWTSSYLLESCKKPAKRCNCSPLLILLWFANGQET